MKTLGVILVNMCVWIVAFSDLNSDKFEKATNTITNNEERLNQTIRQKIFGLKEETEAVKQLPITSPCSCQDAKCSCCAGIRIHGFGFDRQACAVMTYEPIESALHMELLMNNATVYTNRLSTRNQQFCVPIIPVTFAGPFDVCLRLYDVTVVQQRLHACLSMLGRVAKYPMLVLQFNCMEMGAGSVGITRPIGGNYNESAIYPSESMSVSIKLES